MSIEGAKASRFGGDAGAYFAKFRGRQGLNGEWTPSGDVWGIDHMLFSSTLLISFGLADLT